MSRFTQQFTQTKKPFTWSYSSLKSFEGCPKQHYHKNIIKDVIEEPGPALVEGNAVHEAIAAYIRDGVPLPEKYAKHKEQIDEACLKGVGAPGVQILVESRMAMTEAFEPCEFFAKDVWMRGVLDFAKHNGRVGLIVDFKYGKIIEDCIQLALFAQLFFSKYPEIDKVRTKFLWLKDGIETSEDFERKEMADLWAALLPRVKTFKESYDTMNFPAVKNGLCRNWCPVTSCEHNGKFTPS